MSTVLETGAALGFALMACRALCAAAGRTAAGLVDVAATGASESATPGASGLCGAPEASATASLGSTEGGEADASALAAALDALGNGCTSAAGSAGAIVTTTSACAR